MIRIRYRDLSEISPGLHAAAERHGRITTVYLVADLTVPQRRAALRRLRLSARMGRCPRLPAAQLALALLAARIRAAARLAGAVFREHPAGTMVPVMLVSGAAAAFLALTAVPAPGGTASGTHAPVPPAASRPARPGWPLRSPALPAVPAATPASDACRARACRDPDRMASNWPR